MPRVCRVIMRRFWKSFWKHPAIRLKKFLIIVRGDFYQLFFDKKRALFLRGITWVIIAFSLISGRQKFLHLRGYKERNSDATAIALQSNLPPLCGTDKIKIRRKIWAIDRQSGRPDAATKQRKTESKTDKSNLFPTLLNKRSRLPIFVMARYASGKPLAERSARLVRGNAFP